MSITPFPMGDVPPGIVTVDGSDVTVTFPDGSIVAGTILAAPTALAAVQSAANVNVTWTDPASGDVEVYRSDDGAAWALLDTVEYGDESYTDVGVPPGSYRYRLRTADGDSRSVYTDPVSITVEAAPVLSIIPTTAASPATFHASWTADPTATLYRVVIRNGGGVEIAHVDTASTSTDLGPIGFAATYYVEVARRTPTVGLTSNIVPVTVTP